MYSDAGAVRTNRFQELHAWRGQQNQISPADKATGSLAAVVTKLTGSSIVPSRVPHGDPLAFIGSGCGA